MNKGVVYQMINILKNLILQIKYVFLAFAFLFFNLIVPPNTVLTHASNMSPEVAQLVEEVEIKDSYLEAGAVILLKERIMTVEEGGVYSITTHVIGKILNEQAASDYGVEQFHFNSFYQDIHLDFARTIAKDGNVVNVSEDALQIKTLPGAENFIDNKVLTFSIPALEKDSVFEWQDTWKTKVPVIPQQWFENFIFNYRHTGKTVRIDPVYRSRFILKVPEHEVFIYQMTNAEVSPVIEKGEDVITYIWEFNNLEALPIEEGMPETDEIIPSLYVSSLQSWNEIDKWASGLLLPKIEVTPEIVEKVYEITKGAETDEEKIESIFYFIEKDIRYVQAHLSRGGYTPHAVDETLENKYGDCKDQVVLFLSMLKATGITAYPALINSGPSGTINKEIPTMHDFNHVIAYIPREGGDLWLDPTPSVTKFPFLFFFNQDRWAFVVDGKGGKFLKTPSSKADQNLGSQSVEYSFKDGVPHHKIIIAAKGALSDQIKYIYKSIPSNKHEELLRQIIESQYSGQKPTNIEIEWSDINDPSLFFKATALIEFEKMDIEKKFIQHGNALAILSFYGLSYIPKPEDRKNDLLLGFEYQLVMDQLCNPPDDNHKVTIVPQEKSFSNDLLSHNSTFIKEGESVKVKSEFTIKKKRINKEEYREFYDSVQKIQEESQFKIVFNRQKIDEKELKLEAEAEKSPEDISSLLKLAKHYLTKGKYEEAKELLDKAAALEPKNGEIYYVIGLVLGYLDKYEEADKEFKKAKELGYKP